MKKQYGMMGVGAMVGLGFLAVIALGAFWFIGNYYGAYNEGADTETLIQAQYKDMKNSLSSYSLKMADAAQIPGMYRDDFREMAEGVMTARQGEDGSKAMMQWFQEHQINLPKELYVNLQDMSRVGRDKFENLQRRFIDTKRGYEAKLRKDLFLSDGWWMAMAGLPTLDLENDYKEISSVHANDTFETKVDKGLDLSR